MLLITKIKKQTDFNKKPNTQKSTKERGVEGRGEGINYKEYNKLVNKSQEKLYTNWFIKGYKPR